MWVSSALTGPVASRGLEFRDAVVVAVQRWMELNGDEIGGHPISVVAEDDGCTEADVRLTATRRHLQRPGLVGVIGPQCSAGAEGALSLYAAAGVVTISGSAALSELAEDQPAGGFFFRTAYTNLQQALLIAVYVTSPDYLGGDHIFVIDDSEAYGEGLATDIGRFLSGELESEAVVAGARLSRAHVQLGAVDFSALAAEVAIANPDAVIFAGFNPEAGLLLRQLRDAGWLGFYGTGDRICGGPGCDFLVSLGALAEGTAFAGCSPRLDATFVQEFMSVHADTDDSEDDPRATATFVAHYADATTILLNAVQAVADPQADGSLRIEPRALRDAVAATQLPGGLSGAVAFTATGDRFLGPGTAPGRRAEPRGFRPGLGPRPLLRRERRHRLLRVTRPAGEVRPRRAAPVRRVRRQHG